MNYEQKRYSPAPYRQGCTVVKIYDEEFEDAVGNRATINKCDFTNNKGKLQVGYVLQVVWHIDEKWPLKKERAFLSSFYNFEEEHLLWYDGPLSYFFTHEDKLHFAYFGGSFLDYFVFEIDGSERFNFETFDELVKHLNQITNQYYRVTEKKFIDSVTILNGKKAELSFKRFSDGYLTW